MKSTVCFTQYLAFVVLSAIFFAAAVCLPLVKAATDSRAMERAFIKYADTSASGVTRASYSALSTGITSYLGGRAETAQVLIARGGINGEAFSEKELAHLKDVQGLVKAAIRVSRLLGACLAAAAISLAIRLRKRKQTGRQLTPGPACRSIIAGFGIFAAAAAAAAIWAAVDFNGPFILFHRIAFSNSLWMLDPAADLLIQLMPLAFFQDYAVRVLLEWLLLDLTLLLPAVLCAISRKKHGL